MIKNDRLEKKRTVLWLVLIYIFSVLIRYLLGLVTKSFPTVSIDEFLYYSLGRSIATKGSLLYLGQPAVYNYIVYPLILSPVYLLFGQGTNFFRVIQLWNIILMSLAVFPFYGLCYAMVQKRKAALWLTGFFMLLPMNILGEFIYSEAIIYPLFFTLMYCVYRYLKDCKIKYTIWIGILGVLMYYSKPGAVLPAILALLLFAGKAVCKKSGKAGFQVLAGLLCLTTGFFLMKLLAEKVFGYQGTWLSVYDDQAIESKNYNIEYFYNTAVKYPYYFYLAGGILPIVVSLWNYCNYSREDKQYYVYLIICTFLTMIGTAFVVNRPERKEILYLRYVEMYLPVLLVFIAVPEKEHQQLTSHSRKVNEILGHLILGYVTVCTVIWGCTIGVGELKDAHFLVSLASISLAFLYSNHVMGIANILIVFISGATLYLLVRKTEMQWVKRICCILMVFLTILNNIQGYVISGDNTDKKLEEETLEIHQRLGNKEYIHVYAQDQCDFGLDVNSRYNIFRITEADFVNNIRQNRGIYTPFIPESVRGMKAVYQTPDIETIIIDEKIYRNIKLSNETSNFISADNSFQIVSFSKNVRMIDCVLDNQNDSTYLLTIYNDVWLQLPVKICLEIESPTEQNMSIMGEELYSIQIEKGRNKYEVDISEPVETYIISFQDNSVSVNNFDIMTL